LTVHIVRKKYLLSFVGDHSSLTLPKGGERMHKIMLLHKEFDVMNKADMYKATDVETGELLYSSMTRKFIINNVIDQAKILIIDETFTLEGR
jgi:hypothetical protein